MIIAQIVGGLANQMGIYAAARALAEHHGVPLKLDLEDLARDPVRSFELDKLCIPIEIATADEVRKVSGQSRFRTINRWRKSVYKKLGKQAPGLYREQHLHFDPQFFALPATTYLVGNYLSVQYYLPVFSRLRAEFCINLPLSAQSAQWLDNINSTEAVALHVRRTDYVHNPGVVAVHGSLGLSYYTRAIAAIIERVNNPVFYVFSDDPVWARENIQAPATMHYVDCNNAADGYQDFSLMKSCQHYIIANSGFSRWAALLNPSDTKVVVMPKHWMVSSTLQDADVAPLQWLRLDN